MPKLTETFARSTKFAVQGTRKHWDTEIRGFVLFVGKRSKTWSYQRDVAGKTVRRKIGSYPIIGAAAARQAAQAHVLDLSRGSGKVYQRGAPTLGAALESYLARPKLRSNVRKAGVKSQMERPLGDWLGVRLAFRCGAASKRPHEWQYRAQQRGSRDSCHLATVGFRRDLSGACACWTGTSNGMDFHGNRSRTTKCRYR